MKKRLLSLILALVMAVGMLPTAALAAGTDNPGTDETAPVVTVEVYDADGNGRFLLAPTRTAPPSSKYVYASTWIPNAVGSGNITIEDRSYITGYVDSTQADGWLNNGDIVGTSKWLMSVNGTCYDDMSWFYASEINVLRIIFSPSGTGSEFNLSGAGWCDLGTMAVNKDSLIETVSRYAGVNMETNRAAAYQAALDIILDLDATQAEVDTALANFLNAEDESEGIDISETEVELYVTEAKTVTAALTPVGSTDQIVWTSDNPTVAAVDGGTITGVGAGTATITASVAGKDYSDTVAVTVKDVDGISISAEGDAASITAVADTLELTAAVTPEEASGRVQVTWTVDGAASIKPNGYTATVTGKTAGTVTVTAAVGAKSATYNLTVNEYTDPYVYFEYVDGTTQEMDDDGFFTLSALDQGCFRVANTTASAWWENEELIDAGQGSVTYHWYVDRETGAWQPSGIAPTKPITVTAGNFTQTFTIKYQETSGVTALETYVNGVEVSMDAPYEVTGCISGVAVDTKGLIDGKWVDIPVQALAYDTNDNVYYNFRFVGNELYIDRAGSATMTVSLKGESVSTTFKVVCNPVMATAMEVIVPETFEIAEWDAVPNQYVGLRPFTGFSIEFTPANATNRDVTWTALTPDIAVYIDQHSAGIVPKKAGTAEFIVTNTAEPTLKQDVTVTFVYKTPLTAASTEKAYTMKVGDTQPLTINVTPANATEQRFTWTYDKDGIVEVKDKIESDESGTVSWTTHSITALSAGTVTVTGKPYDQTGNCAPVVFTVTVSPNGGSDQPAVDSLALAKDDIAHGLEYLSAQSMSGFGSEWNIFTTLRAGGTVSQADQEAYLASVKAKLESGSTLSTADYARLVLTLGVMGKDPTNFEGYDLAAALYNRESLGGDFVTSVAYALIALDSKDYEIPDDAVWTRGEIVELLLICKSQDGGFSWAPNNAGGDVDTTGMILTALAPYNTEEYPAVQTAFADALAYLKAQITTNAGYAPYGAENSCTAAQVLTALASAGIDPVNAANGFTVNDSNLITNLHQFRKDSGFSYRADSANSDAMSTQQTTYALEAYRRLAEGENSLFDLTDVPVGGSGDTPADNPANAPTDTPAGNPDAAAGTVTVTFRLIGSAPAEQPVDLQVSDYLPGYVTWIPTTAYTVNEGSTVYDVFVKALDQAGLKQEGADANYVKSITAPQSLGGYQLSELTNGKYSGWMYTVNGEYPNVGLRYQTLADGDEIVWHYVNDYRYEAGDWADDSGSGSAPAKPAGGETSDGELPFIDVAGHWALDAVRYVYERDLMNGVGGNRFDPDGTLNRAMLAVILYRTEGEPAVTAASPFTDVAAGTWYTDAVIWAAENGIVLGYGNGSFGPLDNITREQMAAMLMRYARYKGYDVSRSNGLSAYTDAAEISSWALESLQWANAEGLITGRTDTAIVPGGNATRAEAAAILMRLLEGSAK